MKAIVKPRSGSFSPILIFLFIVAICLSPLFARAETQVSGSITEDTTWSLAGSPYIATGDVTVRQSVSDSGNVPTLTIEPGVEVRFAPGTGLYVGDDAGHGVLSAQGTQDAPITFTSNSATPSPGDWKGVVMDKSGAWGSNLCTTGTCQESDYYSNYNCTGGFDGNINFYYRSNSTPSIHWLGYDFGAENAHKVERIRINQYDGVHAEQFMIEGSNSTNDDWDSKSWTILATVNDGRGGWQTIDFRNDTAYRFIRVRSTGGYARSYEFIVWELEMYEFSPLDTAMEYFLIEYGGHAHNANISLVNAHPSIKHSIIRHSSGHGIYLNNSSPKIVNCTIRENNASGIYIEGLSSPAIGGEGNGNTIINNAGYGIFVQDTESFPSITHNSISDNEASPLRTAPMADIRSNTISGNAYQIIEIISGEISADSFWGNNGIPYYVIGDVSVLRTDPVNSNPPTLTIEPGVVIRFDPETGLFIGNDTSPGKLIARGTEEMQIVFTSNAQIPSPGDWKGVVMDESGAWGSNLCTTGTCQESDYYSNYNCTGGFDGNINFYYRSNSTPSIHWLGYDFGAENAHKVERIRINQYDGVHAEQFMIEGSNSTNDDWDSKSWTILATVNDGRGGWQTIDFRNDTAYRFIRVRSTGGYARSYEFIVWELEMYEFSPLDTAMEYFLIEYGGHAHNANISLVNAHPSIKHSIIRHSSGHGIYLEGSSNPTIGGEGVGNTINDNAGYGIFSKDASPAPEIFDNTISNNGAYPIRVGPMAQIRSNSISGDGVLVIELIGGDIDSNTTWRNHGIPYVVKGDMVVGKSIFLTSDPIILTIEPGAEIQFEPETGLFIGTNDRAGTLIAQGNEDSPINFTSNAQIQSPGDWKGIAIDGTALWGSNLCTNGSCNASDAQFQLCAGAFDGNTNTWYYSQGYQTTHWVGYDFGMGNSHKVERIRINQYENTHHARHFVVEGSNSIDSDWDSKAWKTLTVVNDGRGGWQTIDFKNDTAYRFVRVKSTGGYVTPNYFIVWELEMYESHHSAGNLDQCVIEYGGHTHNGNILIKSASPIIDDCIVQHSSKHGVVMEHSMASITNCEIRNNADTGVYMELSSSPSIGGDGNGNVITDNGTYAIYCNESSCYPEITHNAILDSGLFAMRVPAQIKAQNNTYAGTGSKIIELIGGSITSDTVWNNEVSEYRILGDITIHHAYPSNGDLVSRLTIEPGVKIKFHPETGLYIGNYGAYGALYAQGMESNPIFFTSNSESPTAGNWKGIYFRDQTSDHLSAIRLSVIEYGGHTHDANLHIENANPTISRNTIRNSDHSGILIEGSGCDDTPITCNTIQNNRYGIYTKNSALPSIRENSFLDNSDYGLFNESSIAVDAKNNWWDDQNGPNQSGEQVGGMVEYDPWVSVPPDCIGNDIDPPQLSNVMIAGQEISDGIRLFDSAIISLKAEDMSGIGRIEFYIDGNLIHTDNSGNPKYLCYIDVKTLVDGDHILSIVAFDNTGESTTQNYNIQVAFNAPQIIGSRQMQAGGQQVLSLMNYRTGQTYSWNISGGGGQLVESSGSSMAFAETFSNRDSSIIAGPAEEQRESTGDSVLYIAPDSNPGCTDNPIFQVTNSDGFSGEHEIAVNSYPQDIAAYRSGRNCYIALYAPETSKYYWSCGTRVFDCNGDYYGEGCPCSGGWSWDYSYDPTFCENCGGESDFEDLRTEEMINQGCCIPDPPKPLPKDSGQGEDSEENEPPACDISKAGNPIRIYNGNNFEEEKDIRFGSPSLNDLIFKRSYNSQSTETRIIGFGWTHSFDLSIEPSIMFDETEYLKILDDTGRGVYFQYIGGDKYVGAFKEITTVEKDGDHYIWYRRDGSKYTFHSVGKLIAIDDAMGNRTTLSYGEGNRLQIVIDKATGRTLTLQYNAQGFIETITGPASASVPDGAWVTYGYDNHDNLISVTYADGSGFDYTYNDPNDTHNLTEKRDKMGHLLSSWAYDDQDRAIENITSDGRGVSIEYMNDTEVKVTDAYGVTRIYTIGNMDGVKKVTDISGPQGCASCGNDVVRVEYDRALRVIEVEYANGLINQYDDFDSHGNARTEITGVGTADEKITTYTYHPYMDAKLSQSEPSILGQGDKITIWDYDDDGNDTPNENPTRLLHRKIDKGFTKNASGAVVSYEYVTSYTYISKGQVLSIDGPQPGTQDAITYAYNETTGDLLSITSPLVGTTMYSDYDAAGNKGRVTDPNGNTQVYVYDGKGRILTITNEADGSITTYNYNTAGELTQVTTFNGVSTGFTYDTTYGRMTKTTDALGNYVQYAYDTQGNRIEKSLYQSNDERTYQMRYDYQHPGQPGKLWKEINPDNSFAEYDYDAGGNIQSIIDAKGKTTSYGYDDKKRLIQVSQPGNVVTAYAYDDNDNLISVTDAENHTTSYTYDDAGRMISTTSPDTEVTSYAYDAAGNLISKTDAKGSSITYIYDTLNRLTGIHFPDSSQDITYTYDQGADGKGRLTGMTDPSGNYVYTYDALGNLIKEEKTIEGVTYETEYTYDSAGVLTGITYPNGRTVSYQIDNTGRVVQVSTGKDGVTNTVAENIGYLPFGPTNSLTYGNGTVLNQAFDLLYRPEGIVAEALLDFGYNTDAAGNITAITDNLDSEKNRSFQYDALNRLIQATGVFGTIGYAYDKVGNRLSRTIDGETDTYTYESGKNRLSEITGVNPKSFTYDANGNTTVSGSQTLTYNQNDRLIKVAENSTVKGEYTYNGNGQRVKKVSGGETVIYHYDRFGNLIGESTADGTFTREYIYLNSMRLAAFASESTHNEIIVTVTTDDGLNLAGLKVYAFTETGSYTGKYAITDEFGEAEFAISEFSEGSYKFRTDYMSYQFWSEIVTIPGTYSVDIEIEEETTALTITRSGEVQSGVKVYLFNANGSYLGLYEITDENGEVTFDLPVGIGFKFRADTLGSQYFSDIIEIVSGETNTFVIDIGGGLLTLTVDKGDLEPLQGVKAYLFKESGSYLGMYDLTDDEGAAGFEVSSGRYKIRVDYLGYQFWTGVIDTDETQSAVLSIPHNDINITVSGVHNGDAQDAQPRENLKTYLFTPNGSYLGQYQVTNGLGEAFFNLPEKDYKVRVDYLSQQFWSEVFNSVDKAVTINEGIAEVTVSSSGIPIEGVKTYVFNGTGSYLGLYSTSDADGKTFFRLPAGNYNFRADYMGNQYLSGVTTILPHIDNLIPISTGGGAFTATILKGGEEPLEGVKCYLFNEAGAYLGKSGTTNDSGEVSYDISDGSYKIRIDCLGYQFWTIVFHIPGLLSLTHTVPHHDVTITIQRNYDSDILPGDNLKAYLFTPSGTYMGQYQVTNDLGEAVFNLPEKEYKIRVDYLSQQFWSDVFNSTDTTITIHEGMAEIEVLQGASPLSNVKVYTFNASGTYLGIYEVTNADGKASFRLPAATYKFRGDHQGSQYWATETIQPDQVNAIQLGTGGGSFELTVEKEAGVPMTGIKVYVFSPAGSYLGIYDQTDEQGKATFDLSDGAYMFRADYLGYQFWAEVYAVPETLNDTFSIPHQDVTVTVNKVYGSVIEPIENIKAYLFKASGSYMGKYATTDADGQVTFSLPDKDYKVRADYLGSQYWSEVIFQQGEDIDIDHGKVNIHVTNLGEDIENARVYLFTETGSYLGKYVNTDATGVAPFTLPVKSYKFRVDYSGSQYWSEEITPLPDEEIDIDLALHLLALDLTNNPNPVRFDGVPIEYQPGGIMLASIGSLTGILTQSIVAQTPETKIYYYINDHLGTPMKVIDENNTIAWSADYNPFGEADITIDTFQNNFRFPGQYYDTVVELHYNENRYYDPKLGRYLKADPIGLSGGINPYVYADSNPVNIFDPTGLKCWFLFSLPNRWDYRVREKWTNEGEWKLRSMYPEGGGNNGNIGVPWIAATCICEKTRTGKRRKELKMSWLDTYFCEDECDWWFEQRERWTTLWKKTEKIYDTQPELLSGGLFPNESSATMSCATQCQNLNFIK